MKLFCPNFLKALHKAMNYLSGIEVPDEDAEKCLKELSCRRIRHHPPLLPGNPPINRLSHRGWWSGRGGGVIFRCKTKTQGTHL